MTRQDVLNTYDVSERGTIRDLGKFEGEPAYAPYFYDAMMNGDGERIGNADFFVLDDTDKQEFMELDGEYGVTLCETEQGFVYCRAHLQHEYEYLKRDAERLEALQGEME